MRVHTHNTRANIIKIDVCVGVLAHIVFTFYERGKVMAWLNATHILGTTTTEEMIDAGGGDGGWLQPGF